MNRHAPRGDAELTMRHAFDDGGVEPDGAEPYDEVADLLTGTVRVCARRCDTCIFHPGNLMHLQPGRVASMATRAREIEGHVVCHKTLGTELPAICQGFADGPDHGFLAVIPGGPYANREQ